MSKTLETVNLGAALPVVEKGANLLTVLAITTKQTVFTAANEEVVTIDGTYDLKIGQQLIVSQSDEAGIWHIVGVKEAVKAKVAASASRAGACHDKEVPVL